MASSSSLVTRAAAALPSVRVAALSGKGAAVLAGRRDGAGSGGVVLAVRRDGTGRGGILAVEFKVPFSRPVWVVKATGGQSDEPTEEPNAEFKLVRELKEDRDRHMIGTHKFGEQVEGFLPKDAHVALTDYATSSFDLWVVVANRLRPSTESKEYKALRLSGETIVNVVVRCDKGRPTWKSVSDVVEALDLLRRVASTLQAPLLKDWRPDCEASLPMDYNDPTMGLTFVLRRTFVQVQKDIECMLGAN